jgi:hypothetical protein
MSAPWAGVITAEDESRYERAGFGRPSGLGNRPALLIIDVQYRTLGNTSKPFDQALEDYTTSMQFYMALEYTPRRLAKKVGKLLVVYLSC